MLKGRQRASESVDAMPWSIDAGQERHETKFGWGESRFIDDRTDLERTAVQRDGMKTGIDYDCLSPDMVPKLAKTSTSCGSLDVEQRS